MHSSLNRFTTVNLLLEITFLENISLSRYLLQFYLNFIYPKPPACFLTHILAHLLKTIELFNYAFNVFVSIVSGKHGRHELFNMLSCRPISPQKTIHFNTGSKLVVLSTPHSIVLSKSQYTAKGAAAANKTKNHPTTKPLLPMTNHYHYQ